MGLFLAVVVATPAAAHAELATADPADGATVTGSPALITLTFTEAITDKSLFNLKASDGTIVGKGAVDPADDMALVLGPPALAAGTYTIEWQAAAADGHIEKGRTAFTVVEPAPSPTPPPTAIPASTSTDAPTNAPSEAPSATAAGTPATPVDGAPAGTTTDAVIPILGGLVLIGALAWFLLRRGRTA